MVMTASASFAASPGEVATFAPCERSSSALERVRFHSVTLCPARNRCPAMWLPMFPSPMNAIFTMLLLSEFRANSCSSRLRAFLLRRRAPLAPIEAPANDRFKQHMVGGPRHANPQTKVDLPLRRNIQIECRNKLLRLIREGIEPSDRSETAVVLQTEGHGLGEVPRDLRVRRELPTPS